MLLAQPEVRNALVFLSLHGAFARGPRNSPSLHTEAQKTVLKMKFDQKQQKRIQDLFPFASAGPWSGFTVLLHPLQAPGAEAASKRQVVSCCRSPLAALWLNHRSAQPLVDNACASRANRDSWTYSTPAQALNAV